MTAQITIGVAIVSYNTCELLRACLESLRTCRLPLRIIVVDSASQDGSAAMVRTTFPTVDLIALDHNCGFAVGTNLGLRHLLDRATDYLLLLNPDTIVHDSAIETLVAFLETHPRVGAVGPRLLNPDGSIQAAAFRFPTLAMSLLDLFPPGEILPGRLYGSHWHGRYRQERTTTPFPIDHPLGACILARRTIVEQIGLLDDNFFMYAEEVDWCYRIRQAGWAIWHVPQAHVTHIGGAATRQFRHRMQIALYQSRLRFFRKHYTQRFIRWHTWIVRIGMLRATMLAWQAYINGTLDIAELRARLLAYGTIARL